MAIPNFKKIKIISLLNYFFLLLTAKHEKVHKGNDGSPGAIL